MGKEFEKSYPWVAGIAGTIVMIICVPRLNWDQATSILFPTMINVSAILIGFLATAKSIIVAIDGTDVVTWLKEADSYKDFIGYIMKAITTGFIVAVVSFIGVLLGLDTESVLFRVFVSGWAGMCAYELAASHRVIYLIGKLLVKSAKKTSN